MRDMNSGIENRWKHASGLLAAVVFYCSPILPLPAGEAVIFSNEKSRLEPRRPTDAGSDFSRSWERSPGTSPFDVVVPPNMPRLNPADAKAEKRRQHVQDERKNWLLLEQGELTQKDNQESSFGVRDKDYGVDGLDKETGSRDYTFYPLTKQKTAGQNRAGSQPRLPGESQNPDATPANAPKAGSNFDTDGRPRKSSELTRDRDPQFGAHTASELDLRGMLDSRPGSSRHPDKSELTLREFLNNGPSAAADQAQHQRREEFSRFLNSPAPNSPLSGPGDPVNFHGPDQTLLPLNPVVPNAFDAPGRSVVADSFIPGPDFGASGSRPSQPSLFDPNPSRAGAANGFTSPALQPQQPPQRMQVPTFEMPRRPNLFAP